jgi:hypothetical protein
MKKLLLFTFLVSTNLSYAGDNPSLGARTQGMAGSGVALIDLWSAQNNQAGLAFLKTFQAGAFYESRFLINNLGMKAVAAAMPIKAGVFGLSVSSLGLSNLYSENKAGFAFAKAFGTKFSAAVQINYLYTRIGENYGNASTACGEIGIMAEPVRNLKIGFHIYNPTRSKIGGASNERIPTIIRLGGLYSFSDRVFITLEAEKDIDFKPIIRGGLEYRPVENFYLRAGAGSNPGLMAFGCGFVLAKKVRLDLASSFHQTLGFSPAIGLQYGFE